MDANDRDDIAVVEEDSEVRGSDRKVLRSGAPKFPTMLSLTIVGTLTLNERVPVLTCSCSKNTWRRLRKNRLTRMARNLSGGVDGCLEIIMEGAGDVR